MKKKEKEKELVILRRKVYVKVRLYSLRQNKTDLMKLFSHQSKKNPKPKIKKKKTILKSFKVQDIQY